MAFSFAGNARNFLRKPENAWVSTLIVLGQADACPAMLLRNKALAFSFADIVRDFLRKPENAWVSTLIVLGQAAACPQSPS